MYMKTRLTNIDGKRELRGNLYVYMVAWGVTGLSPLLCQTANFGSKRGGGTLS